jgi:DNA-binding PadR family transcriptional regulator
MVKRRFDPEPYLPLTPPMFQLLLALADGDKHGYAIIKEVERRTAGKVRLSAGTLYALIKRFVNEGLIVECDERPDPALDDERRRYYRLSGNGREVAAAEARRMEEAVGHARAKLLLPKPGPA